MIGRKVLAMNTWLTIRTFIALFIAALGIGLMFVRLQDERLILGSLLFAIGVTFLLRMAIELRQS